LLNIVALLKVFYLEKLVDVGPCEIEAYMSETGNTLITAGHFGLDCVVGKS